MCVHFGQLRRLLHITNTEELVNFLLKKRVLYAEVIEEFEPNNTYYVHKTCFGQDAMTISHFYSICFMFPISGGCR